MSEAGAGIAPRAPQAAGRFPRLAIMRFVARRTVRSALLWGLVFGILVLVVTYGYVAAYPDAASRSQFAATLVANPGILAFYGQPHNVEQTAGYVEWRSSTGYVLFGAVWALLTVTRLMRGEEESGRWELLLGGRTTRRQAAASLLGSLTISLFVVFFATAVFSLAAARIEAGSFSAAGAVYFAFVIAMSAAISMSLAALASQLLPTRRAALSWSAGLFGAFFVARAMSDTTASLAWLRDLTPFGWLEQLHPLTGGRPVMLVPLISFVLLLFLLSLWLAGSRDLGASFLAGRDSARPRTRLLGGTMGLTLRLTRMTLLTWAIAAALLSLLYGLLATTAADVVNESSGLQDVLNRLGGGSEAVAGFLGLIFFLFMALLTVFAAAQAAAAREEESGGMLDNLLARPVSRAAWMAQRLAVAAAGIVILALVIGVVSWVAAAATGSGVSFGRLLAAGLNLVPPALLVLGFGTLLHGMAPRLVAVGSYGLVAWSFLLEFIGAAVNLNPYVLDLSLFHHVALAPATDARLGASLVLIFIAAAGMGLGVFLFRRRDITGA